MYLEGAYVYNNNLEEGREAAYYEHIKKIDTTNNHVPKTGPCTCTSSLCFLFHSPLMRLNQSFSSGGGASLLNSTHTAQLQESLRETRSSLERSYTAHQASERSRKKLEAKLDDYQRRHEEVVGVKLTLENHKLDLELEVLLCVCRFSLVPRPSLLFSTHLGIHMRLCGIEKRTRLE